MLAARRDVFVSVSQEAKRHSRSERQDKMTLR